MKYSYMLLLMVFSGWAQSAIKPANGLWRSTDDPDIGSGFMLVTQGEITLVSLFTYTESGLPRWYLAVGEVDENGVFQADLIETINGTSIQTESPTAAEISTNSRDLSIIFSGTQTATFKLDGGHQKSMQAYQYGYPTWQTEHHTLNDGIDYSFADLSGQWVVADENNGESFILELAEVENNPSFSEPFLEKVYLSNFPATDGWIMSCPWQFFPNTLPISQPYCTLNRNNEDLPPLKVPFEDLGGRKINLLSDADDQSLTGFRVDESTRLIPNDGLWRPEDDPAIGSGLVMTTQGDITVILLYSYDDIGQATWGIASGMFNEDGLLETDLLFTEGGSPIEVDGKTTATFTGQSQSLTVQMLGLELATFSIGGSEPKHIQNNNFGVALYETDNLLINTKRFAFPHLSGNWVFIDSNLESLESGVLNIQDYSGSTSPLPPGAPPIYFGSYNSDDYSLSLTFVCPRLKANLEADSCVGRVSRGGEITDLIIYFEDIGFGEFRLYSEPHSDFGRATQVGKFFKISN